MTLTDRIRTTLAPAHTAIEQTPFASAMVAGTISRDEYIVGLHQLWQLHAGLESALEEAAPRCPPLAELYDPARMRRTPLLMADLTALGGHRDTPPVPAVVGLLNHFRKWATDSPWALAGPLYVVEGSRMGSMFLARSLSKALGVSTDPGSGLDNHADGSATRPREWNQFRATLSGLALSDQQQADVIDAAIITMNHMIVMYGGGSSQDPTGRHS